jgi:hypothetical protein
MDKRVLIGLGVLALVILAAGGGYYYGTSVGEARAVQAPQQLFQQRMRGQGRQFPGTFATPQPGQEGAARLGGGILGTIEVIEGDILMVNTQEGTLEVRTTDTTLIEKYSSVGVEDLESGEQVMVSGSRNDDGSVAARSIRALQGRQLPNQPGQP